MPDPWDEADDEPRGVDDALRRPRHTMVFFYRHAGDPRDPELALNPLAQRLAVAGWAVVDFRSDAVIVESERPADDESVDEMAAFMQGLAQEFDVRFDGWESAVLDTDDAETADQ
jgi:hypothetical protein